MARHIPVRKSSNRDRDTVERKFAGSIAARRGINGCCPDRRPFLHFPKIAIGHAFLVGFRAKCVVDSRPNQGAIESHAHRTFNDSTSPTGKGEKST